MPLPRKRYCKALARQTHESMAVSRKPPPKTLAQEMGDLRSLALTFDLPRITRMLDYTDRLTAASFRLLRTRPADYADFEELRETLAQLKKS